MGLSTGAVLRRESWLHTVDRATVIPYSFALVIRQVFQYHLPLQIAVVDVHDNLLRMNLSLIANTFSDFNP